MYVIYIPICTCNSLQQAVSNAPTRAANWGYPVTFETGYGEHCREVHVAQRASWAGGPALGNSRKTSSYVHYSHVTLVYMKMHTLYFFDE